MNNDREHNYRQLSHLYLLVLCYGVSSGKQRAVWPSRKAVLDMKA